jgi:TonB family protein
MNTVFQHKQEQQTKLIGYIVTGSFHILLLALLWFSVLREQDPPLRTGGMELSMALGEIDMGGPSEVPVAEPEAVEAIPEPTPDEQQTVTQDVEEVQVTSKKVVENPKKAEVKKPVDKPIDKPIEKPRTADQRALFKKNTSATAQGGSGDGAVPGNEGNPNGVEGGSPDGNGIGNGLGGSGNGTGRGIGDGSDGYELLRRSIAYRPKVSDNSRETGIVVVAITVDRNGKVIKAEAGVKGSTTLEPALLEKARQGALEARFSPRTDGTGEQYGTISFNFKVIK